MRPEGALKADPILNAAADPEDGPLARERERVMGALSILAIVFLVPFAIHDFLRGRGAAGGGDRRAWWSPSPLDGYAVRKRRQPPIPYALLLIPITAAITMSLATQGVIGAFWCYPVVVFFFFVLPQRRGHRVQRRPARHRHAIVYHYLTMRITVRFARLAPPHHRHGEHHPEHHPRPAAAAPGAGHHGPAHRRLQPPPHEHAAAGGAGQRPPARHPSALLLIDVDHFKRINDEHGHDAGDAVLKGLVSVVRSRARKTDLLFRMGGEEFVLLLPDTTEAQAMTLADDIREAIAASPLLEGHKVTVSIGVGPADPEDSVETRGSRARMPPCTWPRSPAGTAWPAGSGGRRHEDAAPQSLSAP